MRKGFHERAGLLIAAGFFALAWVRVLVGVGIRYTNDDQTIFWYVAQEYLHLHFREPLFYGSPYASHVEAALAAPLLAAGVGPQIALPLVATALTAAPWILYARAAWRRDHPNLAIALLCATFVLPVEYIAINTQAAHGSGIALAAIASSLVLGRKVGAAAFLAFGSLTVLAVLLYPNAIFIAAPIGLVLVLTRFREPPLWWSGGAGAILGAALYARARSFYVRNPSYLLHPQWPLDFRWDSLRAGVVNLDRHLSAVTPVGLPVAAVLAGAAAILIWLTWKTRNWRLGVASLLTLLGVLVSLGIPKVHDGSAAITYAYGRFFLALPLTAALLAILWADEWSPSLGPARRRVAIGLATVFLALAVWRQMTLRREIARVMSVESPVQTIVPTQQVLSTCQGLWRLAERTGAELVVHARRGVYAYGCGALWYGSLDTLFPSYDRRTPRLVDERARARRAILVSEADPDLCARARSYGLDCGTVDDQLQAALVRSSGLSAIAQVRALGMAVRLF